MQQLSGLTSLVPAAEEPGEQVDEDDEDKDAPSEQDVEQLEQPKKRKPPAARASQPSKKFLKEVELLKPSKTLAAALELDEVEPQPFKDILRAFCVWVKTTYPDAVSEDGKSFVSYGDVSEVCQAMLPGSKIMFNFVGKSLRKLCK